VPRITMPVVSRPLEMTLWLGWLLVEPCSWSQAVGEAQRAAACVAMLVFSAPTRQAPGSQSRPTHPVASPPDIAAVGEFKH